MHERQCCCMDICVLYLLVPVAFGTGIVTKSVCLEDSVKLFENVTFNSQYTVVSLYMNHHVHTLMATWDGQNSTINSHILPEYKEKVYLNKDGSIWIQNVNHWDEENYFIVYDRGTALKYEAKIDIKVAPEKNCKPKIRHLDKTLIAFLEDEYCGKPVASLEWLAYPGIYNISKPVINLPLGNEAGTYYACLKGPALECANISTPSDYCSSYTIEGSGSDSETDHRITAILVIMINMGIFLLVFMIMGIWFAYKWNKTKPLTEDQVQKWLHDHQDFMKKNHEKLTSDDQMGEQIQKCLQVFFSMFIEKFLGKLTEGQIEEQIQKGLDVYPRPLFNEKYLGGLLDEQVRKWLMDHPALTDKQNSTEDHRSVSSQVTPSIVPADFGVDDRLPEFESVEVEYQIGSLVKDKISLFEQKSSPHEQPKLNKLQKKNVGSGRCFTGEDPDVDSTNPLVK